MDDLDELLAYIVALEAENQELRSELAAAAVKGVHHYQDGSTSRQVNRENCQLIAEVVITCHREDDGLGAIQAWEECRNDAERVFINKWLNTRQRTWLREQEVTTNSTAPAA
jgi:hypothetical protein